MTWTEFRDPTMERTMSWEHSCKTPGGLSWHRPFPPSWGVFTDNERRDRRKCGHGAHHWRADVGKLYCPWFKFLVYLLCQLSLIHRTQFIAGFGHSNNRGIKVKLKPLTVNHRIERKWRTCCETTHTWSVSLPWAAAARTGRVTRRSRERSRETEAGFALEHTEKMGQGQSRGDTSGAENSDAVVPAR